MNIAGNSEFAIHDSSVTYTYNWGFGGNSLEQVLNLHKLVDDPLLSEDIQFEQGILATIPHHMKIFISKNERLYLCLYFDQEKFQTVENSENRECKISGIMPFQHLNFSNLIGNFVEYYDFELITNNYATLKKNYKTLHGLLPLDSVLKNHNSVYLFRAGCLCLSSTNREHVIAFCKSKYDDYKTHWPNESYSLINFNKRRITSLSFEIKLSLSSWNSNAWDRATPTTPSNEPENTTKIQMKNSGLMETKPFYLSSKFSDFSIQCGIQTFPVHKIILSSKSRVFETMFAQPPKEMETGRLVIEDSTPDIVEEFLRFLYTGEVSKMEESRLPLLLMADKYDVGDLKFICQNSLVHDICENNIVDVYNYAKMLDSSVLIDRCFQVLKRERKKILKTAEDVENFTKLCPGLMMMLINDGCN